MSDQLTRLLTETLHSREADVEPMADLSARVLQKGRSAHRRRLALGWGSSGVAAAAAVAVIVLALPAGQHSPTPAPANSSMPSPTATSPAPVAKTPPGDPLKYARKLPVGKPIALIPRAEKRGAKVVVVTADHVVTLPADTTMAFDLTTSTEGLLVNTHAYGFTGGGPDPDQALYLIRPDGSLTRLHKGPFTGLAVDPTGKKYAIAEVGLRIDAPVHITYGPLSGAGKTVSHTEPTGTRLLGWTTQGLLLSDTSRSWLWEPGGSSEPKIPSALWSSPTVMPGDPGRLLIATDGPGNGFCLHLYTLSSRQMGPGLTCGQASESDWTLSPDGRRAVVGSTVVDLDNGRIGPKLMDGLGISIPHWEDSTHVLNLITEAEPQGQPANLVWVRCDVITGACEQAPIQKSNGASATLVW